MNGLLKLDFSDIDLTTYFGVPKFKNTSAMTVIFFLKMFKIESRFRKRKKKKKKKKKREFLDIYLTTIFGVRKFKKRSAMRVISFLNIFKIESRFPNWKKKIPKVCFVSEIFASEDLAINCVN